MQVKTDLSSNLRHVETVCVWFVSTQVTRKEEKERRLTPQRAVRFAKPTTTFRGKEPSHHETGAAPETGPRDPEFGLASGAGCLH